MSSSPPSSSSSSSSSSSRSSFTSSSSSPPAVIPSPACTSTVNPIRQVVDNIVIPVAPPSKPLIPLSIGDPTVFGNLPVPSQLKSCLVNVITAGKCDGYAPSHGSQNCREVIAARYSYPNPTLYPHIDRPSNDTPSYPAQLTSSDVFLCSGCSGGIDIAIASLADRGHNILIPRPGFPLYLTICGRYGIEAKCYNLMPRQQWEIDLQHMKSLIDKNTKAILINNPSNPNGSVFSLSHMKEIFKIAEEYNLPIISDEVYADMVFKGQQFYPAASIPSPVVVLTVGGIAKQFVCPGWRVGWILLYGKGRNSDMLRNGLQSLTQVIIGCNTLIQGALIEFLPTVGKAYYTELMEKLEGHSNKICEYINTIPGLNAIPPQGSMYLMVHIDPSLFDSSITNDESFAQLLLNEEFVFVLPGKIFGAPNFFRIVICAPVHVMEQAALRIQQFCMRHKGEGKGKEKEGVAESEVSMIKNGNGH